MTDSIVVSHRAVLACQQFRSRAFAWFLGARTNARLTGPADRALTMHLTQFRISACMTACLYLGVGFAYLGATSHYGIWEQVLFHTDLHIDRWVMCGSFFSPGRESVLLDGLRDFRGRVFRSRVLPAGHPKTEALGHCRLARTLPSCRLSLGPRYDDLPRFLVCGHMLFAMIFGFVGAAIGNSVRPRDAAQGRQGGTRTADTLNQQGQIRLTVSSR